jgi:ABC-2 type transport system permease protein
MYTANHAIDPQTEKRLFWQIRGLQARRSLWQALVASRLRLLVVTTLTILLWGGMFSIFLEGFRVLNAAISHEATRTQTVHAIYNIFFLSLLAMLAISSAVILYGSLYDSEEVKWLLTTPARTERIVLHKFQETVLLSCWGFVLLGTPLLIAYGIDARAPWYYYLLLAPFIASFVFIPAGCGAVACILLIYCFPRIRLQAVIGMGAMFLAGLIYLGWSLFAANHSDIMTPLWFQDVLGRLRYSEQRMLPSWWLSSGLLEAAHPNHSDPDVRSWRESLCFLSLLVSHALLAPIAVTWAGARFFRPGYSRLHGAGGQARVTKRRGVDRIVAWLSQPLPRPIQQLLLKDFRLFRRDPLRWTQFLIFFGLLTLYFINMRKFQYGEPLESWMTVIGFLNVAVVSLIQSTFTTRFIFPMISIEGRRFWILGTSPIHRDLVLWSKLIFACALSLVPCATLILLSDFMLQIAQRTPLVAGIHQLLCWSLCVALSGIAVGLGARLPDLRETAPSKIAAGFGGTLNLVLSALLILLVVLSAGVPTYFWVRAARELESSRDLQWFQLGATSSMVCGIMIGISACAIATVIPLRIGVRAFRRLEF